MRNFFDNQDNNDGYPIPDPTDQESDQDSISSAQAAPEDAVPQKQSLSDLMVTPADLDNARAEKTKLALIGAIGNNLSNRQSFGNFFLGKMAPQNDNSQLTKQMMDNADAPIEQKKTLLAQELKKPEMEYMAKATDPNSDLSQTSVKLHQALLNKYGTQLGKSSPQLASAFASVSDSMNGKSAYDIQNLIDKSGLEKVMSSEDMKAVQSQLMASLASQRMSLSQDRLNLQKDNQAVTAAGVFDKDHILTQLTGQQQQIRRDMHTLQSATTLTPQIFNEINLGVANAISGGKSASVTAQGKTEWESLNNEWTSLKQRVSNHPEDINSPEVKQYTADILNRLDQGYQKNMSERARQLSVGRNYGHNQAAQSAVQQKVDSYGQGSAGEDTGYAVIPAANADSGMVSVVSPEGKPGKIPASKLQEALKRGFKRNGS